VEKQEGTEENKLENKEGKGAPTLSEEEYAKLLEQVKELETLRDKYLRSAADYQNARKRLAKEREEFVRFSQEKLIRDILPILDNFERAITHSGTSDSSSAVIAGIQLIWKQLLGVLTAHGLKRFSSEGQAFDPHFHEVVDHVEGEGPEGIVVKEIVPGYSLHDRILRPAKVKVSVSSKTKESRSEEKEEEIT
jgi:molecular chaperone GrpE